MTDEPFRVRENVSREDCDRLVAPHAEDCDLRTWITAYWSGIPNTVGASCTCGLPPSIGAAP